MFSFHSLSIWHIYFIATLTVLPNASLLPILPELSGRLGFSNDQYAAYAMVAPAIGVAVASPIVSRLLPDSVRGLSNVMRVSTVVYIIFGVTPFFVSDFALVYASRLGLGLCISLFHVASFRIITRCLEEGSRKHVLGRQAGFTNIGGVTFVFLSTVVASWHWSLPFLLPCLALLVFLPATRTRCFGEITSTAVSATESRTNPGWDYVFFCTFVAMVGLIAMSVVYTLTTIIPFRIAELSESPRIANSIALSITTLSSAVTGLIFGKLRISTSILMSAAFAFLAFYAAGSGLSNTSYGIYLSCTTLGIGMGLVVPAVSDYIAQVSDERLRSQAFSLLTSSLFVGQFLSPVLSSAFEVVTNGTRVTALFSWSAASASVGCIVLFVLYLIRPVQRINRCL